MFSLTSIGLAVVAGVLGCLIGGTQTFICTGFIGIISTIFAVCGVDVPVFNDLLLNTLFVPCLIFNAAVFGTAYASKNHNIRGVETGRSLAFTNDPMVFVFGIIGAVLGYIIYAILNGISAPVDTGAVSVFIVGVLARLLFNTENTYKKENVDFLKHAGINFWAFNILFGVVVAGVMAFFAKETGLYTIGFSISALSLIFALSDSAFPATHHTTLVAGYAVMQTGNIMLGIVFGLLAHLTSLIFGMIYNTDCGTHVDPPAVAIMIWSFIIFVLF